MLIWPLLASAGGGPETTLVVVNARSALSARIANEYMQLRNIPDTHLLWLDGVPSMGVISIEDFRNKIWSPIRDFLHSHQLDEEIDLIAYSSDFPYAVDFSSDIKARKLGKSIYRGTIASLTALTYFARRVEAGDIGYLGRNYYFRDFAGPKRSRSKNHPVSRPRLGRDDVRQLKSEARRYLNRNDPGQAAETYRAIVDSYPRDAENWYNLARSQAAAGALPEAIESLTEAVDYGWSNSVRTDSDKYFGPLRSDPDFQKLLERMATAYGPFQLTHGFRSRYVWSNADLALWEPADSLNQYYLSTMLAYTGSLGNSFPEVMRYLSAAAASDATRPEGTVYLLENTDVRSRTRQPFFPVTLSELAKRGRRGEVLTRGSDDQTGILPVARDDIIGAVVGFRRFHWEGNNSRLLPGAIAESLTSYGGDFNRPKQTKLSEFLRHGAAGSSGAVAEPYAFKEKFPLPLIHAWYADGCSLAESFYQSVKAPYQLIVVGDPLARPFASFAGVRLKSPDPERPWSGIVSLAADIDAQPADPVGTVEFWVDGQYQFDVQPHRPFSWDTRTVEDGSHEIRLVAVEDSRIETRSSKVFLARVFNSDRQVEIESVSQSVSYDGNVEVAGTASGAERVELVRGHRVLGEAAVDDTRWRLAIPARMLGIGPVSFLVRAHYQDGSSVRSDPVRLSIGLPETLTPLVDAKPAADGLKAIAYDAVGNSRHLVIGELDGVLQELRKSGLKAERVVIDGYFRVAEAGFYQLGITAGGTVKVSVNDQLLTAEDLSPSDRESLLPLSLEPGWYKLGIDLAISGHPFLKAMLAGDQLPMVLAGDAIGHVETDAGG